jgi:hypothetical protein
MGYKPQCSTIPFGSKARVKITFEVNVDTNISGSPVKLYSCKEAFMSAGEQRVSTPDMPYAVAIVVCSTIGSHVQSMNCTLFTLTRT